MNNILAVLESIGFLNVVWLFVLVFMIHEFEEWNIAGWERRNFEHVPPIVTDRSARTWIGFICLVAVVWGAVAVLPGSPAFAAFVLLNALQHVFWLFYFKQYAPGVITAVLLLIPAGCYLVSRAVLDSYVPIWYVLVLAIPVVLGLIQTIKAGNEMTAPIRAIHTLGYRLSEMLSRPG